MPELSRREFLHAVAASTLGAVVFTGCQPQPSEGLTESRVLQAEDTLSAYENWYATTCRECSAGCGLIIRVIEGRAKKAEGNPDHPVNLGKLCARGQAVVQAEYHPDRLAGPQARTGPRTAAAFAAIGWDQALDQLASRIRELQARGQADRLVLITPPLRGQRAMVVDRFCTALGARWLSFDPIAEAPLRAAMQRVYGRAVVPDLDIQNSDLVLSFGADFLGTWSSPVRFSHQYGLFRQVDVGQPRGYLVALEPRFSVTAANADEWVPTRPGSEGLLAQSIASAVTSDGGGVTPEQAEPTTGVPAPIVREIAARFAAAQRPLAIGGGIVGAQTNGTDALTAILQLNLLAPSQSVPIAPPAPLRDFEGARAPGTLGDWQALTDQLRSGQVDTVLIWNANPVYGLPSALDFESALRDHPGLTVSFSSLLDETSALADLVLPTHLPLEDWGDDVPEPAPSMPVLSMQQPIVAPLHDTRGFADVLLTLADELGGDVASALPWPTFKDALRDAAKLLQAQAEAGAVQDFERFWVSLLQRGGWWQSSPQQTTLTPRAAPTTLSSAVFDGNANDYPYHLLVFPHHTLGAGNGAYLPWLQATPDPLTSVTWQTWVEVNPRVAERTGVKEGDIVVLESAAGHIEVPVYVHPAAPPDVLAVPLGQGHRVGRWARDRGANPMALLAPLADVGSGALAYGSTRVRMRPTGRHTGLPKLEGTVPAYQLPEQEVIQIARG
jgi:menaquinone reductase, molybdopterin-binding-like subunit